MCNYLLKNWMFCALKYNNVEFVDNVHALLKCLIAASADI